MPTGKNRTKTQKKTYFFVIHRYSTNFGKSKVIVSLVPMITYNLAIFCSEVTRLQWTQWFFGAMNFEFRYFSIWILNLRMIGWVMDDVSFFKYGGDRNVTFWTHNCVQWYTFFIMHNRCVTICSMEFTFDAFCSSFRKSPICFIFTWLTTSTKCD